jgi:hypothetical protein
LFVSTWDDVDHYPSGQEVCKIHNNIDFRAEPASCYPIHRSDDLMVPALDGSNTNLIDSSEHGPEDEGLALAVGIVKDHQPQHRVVRS